MHQGSTAVLDFLEVVSQLRFDDDSLGSLGCGSTSGCGETVSGCEVTECCITNCQGATCAATCGVTCT